jgi:hypothetical protein
LDAVMALPAEQRDKDVGASHKGLTGTLDHILCGDRVWIARMLGKEIEAIPADWSVVHKCWDDWAAAATDEALSRIVEYKDLRGAEVAGVRNGDAHGESCDAASRAGDEHAAANGRRASADGFDFLLSRTTAGLISEAPHRALKSG